jgi:mannosylglycoprotein endo-beta-mannosidase
MEKLDRVLMSHDWDDLFPLVTVTKLVKEISDHNALLLDSGVHSAPLLKSRDFHFDTSWLKNAEFLPSVDKIWGKHIASLDPIDVFNIKLKRFKKYFKGWCSYLYGHNKKRKRELKEELTTIEALEEADDLSPKLCIRKTDINVELFNLYADEEKLWFQRSQEKFLLEGDSNTSYFHRVANGRKGKNTMFSLTNNSVLIKGTDKLLNHATDYYKSLFGPGVGNMIPFDADMWRTHEKLSSEENLQICQPFTLNDVKSALDSMASNKVASPDNIHVEFYQHCWDIFKWDAMNLFHSFHAGTLDVFRLNYGIITLIPKVSRVHGISQYRPICHLRCIYKLITKTLTLRLEPFMKKIIGVNKNAFMKKRSIVDGIMSLHEILHHTH